MSNIVDIQNGRPRQALFIDWMTLYGIAMEPIVLEGVYRQQGDVKTSMWFSDVRRVECFIDGRWQPFAVLCQHPTTPQMATAMVSIKIANHILYRPDYYDLIIQMLIDWHVGSVHISRLDVAADFLELACGWGGEVLASKLASGRCVRKGSRKVKIFARSPYHISNDGKMQKKSGGIESITFGTHASVCQFQLYNKTEELRQASMGGYCPKEYIRDCWKQAGVWSPERDTWRIELRLTSKAHSLVNTQTGQMQPVDLYSLRPEALPQTILAIFAKWAEIRSTERCSASDVEHFSRLKRVELLSWSAVLAVVPRCKPVRVGLPSSNYIKGLMTTIMQFKTQFEHLLPDITDKFILGDALAAIKCIYSEAKSQERKAEVERFIHGANLSLLDVIELSPMMTESEEHYFAYVKAIESYYKSKENTKNRNQDADNQRQSRPA